MILNCLLEQIGIGRVPVTVDTKIRRMTAERVLQVFNTKTTGNTHSVSLFGFTGTGGQSPSKP